MLSLLYLTVTLSLSSIQGTGAAVHRSKGKSHATTTESTPAPTTSQFIYSGFRNDDDLFGLKTLDGSFCFLASFEGRLVIKNLDSWVDPSEFVYLPDNANLEGQCALSSGETSVLEMSWSRLRPDFAGEDPTMTPADSFRLRLQFESIEWLDPVKNAKEYWWKLGSAQLNYIPPHGVASKQLTLSNSKGNAELGKAPQDASREKSPSGLNAPMGQALFCKHHLNVTLEGFANSYNRNNDSEISDPFLVVILQIKKDLQIQPFEVVAGGSFGTSNNILCVDHGVIEHLCERSKKLNLLEQLRSTATIASGCLLALATVGVLVGYAVKRQFFPATQAYASMD